MTSPAATSVTRRRQRSTRLPVAVALLVLAAVLVVGAVVVSALVLVAAAAVAAVVLGAAATKITHTELVAGRREANRDRAAQAKAYDAITAERIAENRSHTEHLTGLVEQTRADRDKTVAELEAALAAAHQRAAEAIRSRAEESRRAAEAQIETTAVRERLAEAEGRAAEAIVRVAELEDENGALRTENEVLTSELAAASWRPQVKHA